MQFCRTKIVYKYIEKYKLNHANFPVGENAERMYYVCKN